MLYDSLNLDFGVKKANYLIIRLINCTFAKPIVIVHQKKEEDDKETPHPIHSNYCITGNGKSVCLRTTK